MSLIQAQAESIRAVTRVEQIRDRLTYCLAAHYWTPETKADLDAQINTCMDELDHLLSLIQQVEP